MLELKAGIFFQKPLQRSGHVAVRLGGGRSAPDRAVARRKFHLDFRRKLTEPEPLTWLDRVDLGDRYHIAVSRLCDLLRLLALHREQRAEAEVVSAGILGVRAFRDASAEHSRQCQ